MTKPEVTLENYEAVYDYYLEHQQPRIKAMAAYAFLALKYHPRIHYAEGAKEQAKQLETGNTPLLIAANHPTNHSDQYILAATAWKSPLRHRIGHMRVLGKDDLFESDDQRDKVDMMGTIPVFRGKDHGMRAVNAAGQRMMDICAERLYRGDSIAIFPEGEHNEINPETVNRVNSGIGHIAARAIELGAPLNLLSIGIAYDQPGPHPNVKSASVFINAPISTSDIPGRPAQITRLVKEDLQSAVDNARLRYQ